MSNDTYIIVRVPKAWVQAIDNVSQQKTISRSALVRQGIMLMFKKEKISVPPKIAEN